jgi:hypothetical protein
VTEVPRRPSAIGNRLLNAFSKQRYQLTVTNVEEKMELLVAVFSLPSAMYIHTEVPEHKA